MKSYLVIFLALIVVMQMAYYSEACKPLWDNSCKNALDCCSLHCYKEKHWAVGVCKPFPFG